MGRKGRSSNFVDRPSPQPGSFELGQDLVFG